MELHTEKKNHATCLEILLSVAVPAPCSGGAALGILLRQGNGNVDAGSFYRGSFSGAVLLACLTLITPIRAMVSLPATQFAVIIFLLPFGNTPAVLLQLLFAAALTILVVRRPLHFSTPPVKKTRRRSYGKVPV
jgi:hypothetical protein